MRQQVSDVNAEAEAAEEASQELLGSYEELERKLESMVADAEASEEVHARIASELTQQIDSRLKLPAAPRWDELSDARARSKRSEDVKFWSNLLTESQVRPRDLSTAMAVTCYGDATYHEAVFHEREY